MCNAFCCIVMRNGTVYWQAGMDSHDDLISKFKVRDDTTDMEEISHAKIEIIPDNMNKYPYLYPDEKWKLVVDERVRPSWLLKTHEDGAWRAWAKWKEQVYQFNYQEAVNPINPLSITRKGKVSKADITLLKKWDSVRDSVGASVGASVRDSIGASVGASIGDSVRASVWASIWDSVGDSVGAYSGSLFPNITEWKYLKGKQDSYPYQPAVDLWKRGLISSFDGKIWRLHSGKDAKVIFKISKTELKKSNKE